MKGTVEMDEKTKQELRWQFNLTTENEVADTREMIEDMIKILQALLNGKDISLSRDYDNKEDWPELKIGNDMIRSPLSHDSADKILMALDNMGLHHDTWGIRMPRVASVEEIIEKIEYHISGNQSQLDYWKKQLEQLRNGD